MARSSLPCVFEPLGFTPQLCVPEGQLLKFLPESQLIAKTEPISNRQISQKRFQCVLSLIELPLGSIGLVTHGAELRLLALEHGGVAGV